MDKSIVKGLCDKLYDKRKATALELEKQVRQYLAEGNHEKIRAIIDELCRDYAYAVHQPNARNAGLMGLAAAAIALGTAEVPAYLESIILPVLACFGDQSDQVRFYACESLYNIAKIAKGEILVYFNEIFDVLCKISADSETSVKGAADLLDRLIKDIVSEKASSYISTLVQHPEEKLEGVALNSDGQYVQVNYPQDVTAFNLSKFMPLLMERIYAINPDSRMFLVSWLQVLESVPDLELVSYLPSFLGGLLTFLGDSHKDVRVVTQSLLEDLLHEVKRIADLKKTTSLESAVSPMPETPTKTKEGSLISEKKKNFLNALEQLEGTSNSVNAGAAAAPAATVVSPVTTVVAGGSAMLVEGEKSIEMQQNNGELYYPGQDVDVDYTKIIEILVQYMSSADKTTKLVVLNWSESILDIYPLSFIPFLSKMLTILLHSVADSDEAVAEACQKLNNKLIELVESQKEAESINFGPIVNTLTLHFMNSSEITKLTSLDWLALIHQKVPDQLLEHNDSTFLTLLKSLSDQSERVIDKSLSLLSELCNESSDASFSKFMSDILGFCRNDRKLLESRGNFILKQLCLSLPPERIYKSIAELLQKETDLKFVSVMVQILNNNLVTAKELAPLRKKLRTPNGKLFAVLFKAWSHNPAALLILCLLAESYQLAYQVLQVFVEYEITVSMLIQIDILVQLLESPVFTKMRLQLLEPNQMLYKCLYGILMLLPQSTAFTTLKNRLSSVAPLALSSTEASSTTKSPTPDYTDLLQFFDSICAKHEQLKN